MCNRAYNSNMCSKNSLQFLVAYKCQNKEKNKVINEVKSVATNLCKYNKKN